MSDFKKCTNCGFVWHNRADFINDDDVTIIGYQVLFDDLLSGLFLFNHFCKGTLSIEVSVFEDLYTGPVYTERATGTDACSGHCLHKSVLEPCPVKCECAFVREIIQHLKESPDIAHSI
jgi:hypothetical protein